MASIHLTLASRAQSVLHLAKQLHQVLDQPAPTHPLLVTEVEALASSPLRDATDQECLQLHREGVELWNKSRYEVAEAADTDKTLLAQVRAFAYFILSRPPESVAIRAARACIDVSQYSIALSILERISSSSSPDYALLRILLAWKQDQASVADFFFLSIGAHYGDSDKENAVGLFYEIGTKQLEKHRNEEAMKWLGKAYEILQTWDWRSSFDGPELRLNVLHAYTRSLFAVEDHVEEACNMLAMLESDHPQRLAVLLLKIEHHSNANELHAALDVTIQSIPLMESNVRLVLHYVDVLSKLNLKYACRVLTNFTLKRLIPDAIQSWIETAIITLIWMIVSDNGTYGTPACLQEWLSPLWQACTTPLLSPEASQAAIVLIWKRIEQAFKTEPETAAKWSKIALILAPQADLSGGEYLGKLGRKLAACCIVSEDYAGAQSILDHLPDESKAHHLTHYLTYSVAIRNGCEEAAERALSSLAFSSKDIDKLLFACVFETQKYGSTKMQAKLLQRILDKYINESHPSINLCALLRATARLLWQLLERDNDNIDEEVLDRLCTVFKTAKNFSVTCNGEKPIAGQLFDVMDCEWFSKNGCSLALRMIRRWPAAYILRILENTANLKYPDGIDEEIQLQQRMRNANMAYARIILSVTEARNGDKAAYAKAMNVYQLSDPHNPILQPLMPLIFEAAVHSGLEEDRQRLPMLLVENPQTSLKAYAACADVLISSVTANTPDSLQVDHAVPVLYEIIDRIRTLPGYDIVQTSRWIRCVTQLILDSYRSKWVAMDAVVVPPGWDLIHSVLSEAAEIVGSAPYPQEELEWLAITLFNLALDIYVAEKDGWGKTVAHEALTFAGAMEDKTLERMLRDKMRRISWC